MTKQKLIDEVYKRLDITKKNAEQAINAVVESIEEALQSGEDVRLIGFGTFSTVQRKERQGRHPQTGELINIPSKKTVKFKPGKDLVEKIR